MIPEESIHAANRSANILQPGLEVGLARARLALIGQLQGSLTRSRNALLALDLAGIEKGTREQLDLSRKLAEGLRRRRESADGVRPLTGKDYAPPGFRIGAAEPDNELEEELRQNELGVFEALRLHLALLARLRSKLLVLSNMLAGPSVNYGPPWAHRGAPPHASHGKQSGGI